MPSVMGAAIHIQVLQVFNSGAIDINNTVSATHARVRHTLRQLKISEISEKTFKVFLGAMTTTKPVSAKYTHYRQVMRHEIKTVNKKHLK